MGSDQPFRQYVFEVLWALGERDEQIDEQIQDVTVGDVMRLADRVRRKWDD